MAKKHFTDEEMHILREYVTSVRQELFKEPVPDDQHAELLFELEGRIRQHPIFQDHLKRIDSNFETRVHERKELLKQQAGIKTEKQTKQQKARLKGIRRLVLFVSLLAALFVGISTGNRRIPFNITFALITIPIIWASHFFVRFILEGFRPEPDSYQKAVDMTTSILKWLILFLVGGIILYLAISDFPYWTVSSYPS